MATATGPYVAISNHDPILIGLLDQVLTKNGFKTLILPEGSTAYQVIKKEKPDLIVMDTAPGGGVGVLFQILRLDEETIQIPVLICSDLDAYSTAAAGLKHHSSVEVLAQPYDTDVLVPTIQGMIDQNELSKKLHVKSA